VARNTNTKEESYHTAGVPEKTESLKDHLYIVLDIEDSIQQAGDYSTVSPQTVRVPQSTKNISPRYNMALSTPRLGAPFSLS
jgi:hypothetical protein